MSPFLHQSLPVSKFLSGLDVWIGIDWGMLDVAYLPLVIFILRTINLTLSTVRMLFVLRGRKLSAWILAVLQSVLYIISVAGVLSDLQNPITILAYAGGFATGNVVGMWMENRLAPGHSLLRITSSTFGSAIREEIHAQGYGATEIAGTGKDGTVSVLYCFIPRKKVPSLQSIALGVDPEAFLSVVYVRQLRGGWRF